MAPGSEWESGAPGLFPTTYCTSCIFLLSAHISRASLRSVVLLGYEARSSHFPQWKSHLAPPVAEPFCSWARPTFSARAGRGTQKGKPYSSAQRGKLRHRAGLSLGRDPGVPVPGSSNRGLALWRRQPAERHCSVFLSSQWG